VKAVQKRTEAPIIWEPEVYIAGSRQLLSTFGKYPPKHFPTAEAAIEYGKKFAEHLVDHPAGKKREIL
jgi:hypothetical protein